MTMPNTMIVDVQTGNLVEAQVPPEEVASLPDMVAELTNSARTQRDALLGQTDWVVVRAYEEGKPIPPQWATYRQALRDVPQQVGFPDNIQWPTKPE